MGDNKIWEVLGIEETKDEGIIKTAYKKLLVTVNPEDDAQGFMALRSAYEEAIKYARKPEEAENAMLGDNIELTVADRWLKKLEALYDNMSDRSNPDKFKELLDEDYCISLDTSEEAREKLLAFAMEHNYISGKCWRAIDAAMDIVKDAKLLYEKFPKNYIDYVVRTIQEDDYAYYEAFNYVQGEDADEYINTYYELRRTIDHDELDKARELMEKLEAFKTTHPYLDVEKMRMRLCDGDREGAILMEEELKNSQYSHNFYIRYGIALNMYNTNRFTMAAELCREILKDIPDYFNVKVLLVRALYQTALDNLKEGKPILEFNRDIDFDDTYLPIREAEETLFELYDVNPADTRLEPMLNKISGLKLEQYQKRLEEYPQEYDSLQESAWCYFRLRQYKKAIEVLLSCAPEDKTKYAWINLIGRAYAAAGNNREALGYLINWAKLIEETPNDDNKRHKRRKEIQDYAYFAVASTFAELKDYNNAIEYYDRCVDISKNTTGRYKLAARDRKANCYLAMKEYAKAIDECSQIIEEDDNFYPAYVTRMICMYNMHNVNELMDNYYHAISIYALNFEPYFYACKTLINLGNYEDARHILDEAENNKIESNSLAYLDLKIKRLTAKNEFLDTVLINSITKLNEFINAEASPSNDIENMNEVIIELSKCYNQLGKYNQSVSILTPAIDKLEQELKTEYDDTDIDLYYALAMTYYSNKDGEHTIKILDEILAIDKDNLRALYAKAKTYINMSNSDGKKDAVLEGKAYDLFDYIDKICPSYSDVNIILMERHQDLANKNLDRAEYEKAVEYATREVNDYGGNYAYMNRGRLYDDGYEFYKAIEDYKKVIEAEPQEWSAYNNMGYIYELMRELDKAKEYYTMAMERVDMRKSPLPYINIANCYIYEGDFENAIKIFEQLHQLDLKDRYFMRKLAGCHRRLGEYSKADEMYYQSENNVIERHKHLYHMWGEAGNTQKMQMYLDALAKDVENTQSGYNYLRLAEFYIHNLDYEHADVALNKALHATTAPIKNSTVSEYKTVVYVLLNLKLNADRKPETKNKLFGIFSKASKGLTRKSYDTLIDMYANEAIAGIFADDANGLQRWNNRNNDRAYKGHFLKYVDWLSIRPERLVRVAVIAAALGEYEYAKELAKQALSEYPCRNCTYNRCHDAYYTLGLIYELQGDYTQALENYTKAYEIQHAMDYRNKIKEMQSLLNK